MGRTSQGDERGDSRDAVGSQDRSRHYGLLKRRTHLNSCARANNVCVSWGFVVEGGSRFKGSSGQ
jgi:hypothetical protein